MGYLWTRTMYILGSSTESGTGLILVIHVCMFVCSLTKLVANCGGLSRVRGFTDAGRVAAPDTEAVGLPFGEIKQCKARRLDWDLCVHSLPAVCA